MSTKTKTRLEDTQEGQAALGRVFAVFLEMSHRSAGLQSAVTKLDEAAKVCTPLLLSKSVLYDNVANTEATHNALKSISEKVLRITILLDEVATEWKRIGEL